MRLNLSLDAGGDPLGVDSPSRKASSRAQARVDWQSAAQPLALGWPRDPVWARPDLRNRSDQAQTVWLEVLPSRLTRVRLHNPLPDGRWHRQASGKPVIAAERPLNMAELDFPLSLAGADQALTCPT